MQQDIFRSKMLRRTSSNRSKGEKRDVVCEIVQKCLECKRTVSGLKQHICGHATCSNCKEYCDPQTHQCYMLPVETKGGACTRDPVCHGPKKDWCLCCKTRTTKYMFYDLETRQDTGTHVVNYVNAQDFDGNEFTFKIIEEFCKFVFTDQHKGYTFIAHNAKSFDAQFILKYCIDNAIKPFCIYNGTKIMYMAVKEFSIRFIDSINFVSGALATLPKTFGFSELKKGYFPHLFNIPGNQNYVGQGPRSNFWIEGAECLQLPRGGAGAGATIEPPFLLRSFSIFPVFVNFLSVFLKLSCGCDEFMFIVGIFFVLY